MQKKANAKMVFATNMWRYKTIVTSTTFGVFYVMLEGMFACEVLLEG